MGYLVLIIVLVFYTVLHCTKTKLYLKIVIIDMHHNSSPMVLMLMSINSAIFKFTLLIEDFRIIRTTLGCLAVVLFFKFLKLTISQRDTTMT